MKQQQISTEEQTWRQSATHHEFPLRDGDWAAMEQLIDQQDKGVIGGLPGGNGTSFTLGNRWTFPFLAGVLISLVVLAGQGWSDQEQIPDSPAPVIAQQPLMADLPPSAGQEAQALIPVQSSETESSTPLIQNATKKSLTYPATRNSQASGTGIPPVDPAQMLARTDEMMQATPVTTPAPLEESDKQRPAVSDFSTLTEEEYTPGLMAFSRLTGKVGLGVQVDAPELPTPASPSLPTPDRWSFGLLAGARMALPDWPMETASPGGLAGAFVQYDLTPRWSIRAELAGKLLDRDLQRSDSNVLLDEFGATLNVDQSANTNGLLFVEMPLLAVYRQGRHEWFGGPKLALVRVRNDASSLAYSGNAFTEVNSYSIVEGVRSFDAGLTLGYGYRLFRHWGVDLRYNQGLLDLTHDNFFNNTHTLINSDLQLTIRYVF